MADGDSTWEERELARLIVAGYSDEEIAKRLLLSVRTMYRLLRQLMVQHDLPNRAALGAFAASRGWLPEFSPPPGQGGGGPSPARRPVLVAPDVQACD